MLLKHLVIFLLQLYEIVIALTVNPSAHLIISCGTQVEEHWSKESSLHRQNLLNPDLMIGEMIMRDIKLYSTRVHWYRVALFYCSVCVVNIMIFVLIKPF